jgi:hypothetical protein
LLYAKIDYLKVNKEYYEALYKHSENENADLEFILSDLAWHMRDQVREINSLKTSCESYRVLYKNASQNYNKTFGELQDTRFELMKHLSRKPDTLKFDSPNLFKSLEDVLTYVKQSTVVVYPYFSLTHDAPKELVDKVYDYLLLMYPEENAENEDIRKEIQMVYEEIYESHDWL